MKQSIIALAGLFLCVLSVAETKSFVVYKNEKNETCDSINANKKCLYEYSDFENRIGRVRVENMEGTLLKVMEGAYIDSVPNKIRNICPIMIDQIKDGSVTSYREDGSLHTTGTYKNYLLHGEFRSYYPNGQVTRIDNYQEDKLISGQCFTPEGIKTDYFEFAAMPEYKGGLPGLKKFLSKTVRYPAKAQSQGIQGRVLVGFVVENTGDLNLIFIEKSVHPLLDEEALRVVRKMKKWKPGVMDNQPIGVRYMLPVNFVLQ